MKHRNSNSLYFKARREGALSATDDLWDRLHLHWLGYGKFYRWLGKVVGWYSCSHIGSLLNRGHW